ncbi:MAG: SdpI family protein [Salinibacterium sp.]|nr:SdpI family protein [Salinibacterium sp.]
MSPVEIVLPAVLLLAGIVSIIGARGGLPRNRYFGVRVNAAMGSDVAWVAAHRAAIAPAWIGFVTVTAVAAIAWFGPSSLIALRYVVVFIFIAAVAATLVIANRAGRAASSPGRT